MLTKTSRLTLVLTIPLIFAACSDDSPPAKPSDKPTHVWSDQVENLHQAKEVAKFAEDSQALEAQRIKDLGIEPSDDGN